MSNLWRPICVVLGRFWGTHRVALLKTQVLCLGGTLALSGLMDSVVAQERQEPLRARIDVVVLDFVAVDKRGAPIVDLRPGEVVLTVEGMPRPLSSLDFVKLAETSAASAPVKSPDEMSADRRSTGPPPGRTVVLLFAHESIRPGNERPAVEGAARFLKHLLPTDRVALITIPTGRIEVNLTTDHEAVRSALYRVVGRSLEPVPRGGRLELLALTDVLRGLSQIEGRKAVVLVSEGVCPPNIRNGPCARESLTLASFEDIGRAAAQGRADLFLLQPHNMPVDASRIRGHTTSMIDDEYSKIVEGTSGLKDLALATGGEFFRLSGAADAVFDRIARETSAYYLAGFGVDESDRTGNDRKIVVRVTRPGVTVRARPIFRVESTSR